MAHVRNSDKCQRTLKKLYALQLKHGGTNKHNFLIRGGVDEAVLIDSDSMIRCQDEQALLAESEGLREQLEENSRRGGMVELPAL
jgi:hypothetical protein